MTGVDGQIVMVTGAASGIGLGIPRAFHEAGASVVLGDFQREALEQAQATLSDQERLAFVPVDVRTCRQSRISLRWRSRRLARRRS